MCEQTEINYLDGEVVWVKLGSCWWPGEVVGPDKLPPDVLPSFRKPPIAVVKFFQEDAYEYVKNLNSIYKYNCNRKNEFINKGLYMYRTKHGHMEKFPEDVIRAEAAVGGDITILTRDEFQEPKKESYADLFGDPSKKTPQSSKKGRGRGRPSESFRELPRKININKPNYKVHILVQGPQSTPSQTMSSETASTPSTSRAGSEPSDENKVIAEQPVSTPPPTTPKVSSSGMYSCHACAFTTARLNVLILHNKTHSVTFMPYTPSPVRKKITKPLKSNTTKTTKVRKSRLEKIDKTSKKTTSQKRVAEDKPIIEVKKTKTDEEIKSSLLADWDIDDDSNDESSVMVMAGSPEVAAPAESPAVAPPAELPEAQVPIELPVSISKNCEDIPAAEKAESSSDSKYEFCEDEDWLEEADVGRKIPRVMNPKRKEDTKSISIDDDEVAREVAELLNKTTVPELPSAPEPLKVEENFPEPSIVKSPDKKPETVIEAGDSPEQKHSTETQAPKTIFKTKTFFRSRHSRSQDAIGKYVAEQLNAERLDISEDMNGSEILPAEVKISLPIEPVKVARLAPKIQLKKMKAEAAQMREKEKTSSDKFKDDSITHNQAALEHTLSISSLPDSLITKNIDVENEESQEKYDFTLDQIKSDSPNNITQIEVEHLTRADDISLDQLQDSSTKELDSFYGSPNIKVNSTIVPELKIDVQEVKKSDLVTEGAHSPNKTDCQYHLESNESEQSLDFLVKPKSSAVINNNLKQQHDVLSHKVDETKVKKQTIESQDRSCVLDDNEILCKDNLVNLDIKGVTHEGKKLNESHTAPDVINENLESETSKEDASPRSAEPFMNESTASAVDALLSVSRETDRVTRLISNDLPEDLFEDDNKDNLPKNVNGVVESNDIKNNFSATPEMEVDDKTFEVTNEKVVDSEAKEDFVTDFNMIATDECKSVKNDTSLNNTPIILPETTPSESDLQIAETLINLPSTTIQNKVSVDHQENMSFEHKQFEDDSSFSSKSVALENNQIDVDETCVQDNIEIPANHITCTDNLTSRFETEQEKSENLYAAQSLVQMSESIEHNINVAEISTTNKTDKPNSLTYIPVKDHEIMPIKEHEIIKDQKLPILTIDKSNELSQGNGTSFETSSPKLLKILEEPCPPKIVPSILAKPVIVPGKEKILNFDGGKPGVSGKTHSPKQKIIIRRSNTPHKNILNSVNEVSTPDKIILSRSNNPPIEGSSIQTYTIQTAPEAPSDPNTIVIQQKVKKITKPSSKLQKPKSQTSVVPALQTTKNVNDIQSTDDVMFDINSMPIVLSEDILTPESIEKMPIVMSDGNIIANPSIPQKTVKPKQTIIESEKIAISPTPQNTPKQEFKTLIVNPVNESNKVTTPNILSKSSKLRGTKMLVIDKTSGKQKIIMTKQAPHTESTIKEIKSQPTLIKAISQNVAKPQPTLIQAIPQNVNKHQPNLIQSITQNANKAHPTIIQPISQNAGKTQSTLIQSISQTGSKPEKFILLPTTGSPRPGRTQKIVIDPQTGKAHMFLGKGADSPMQVTDSKPVSAKLVTSAADANAPGNTVMIITNSQGAQSRIVLKPEHEKILFPNKQQPNISQLKTITHRVSATSGSPNKSIVTSVASVKTPTRIVPKQTKGAIITSKGQLIVGGRVATTAQNIAPMPEIRPSPKRIIASDSKKISIQKNSTEPLIFFQQKSGAMMQLTAAQFEHLQRTGQIIQKTVTPSARESKVVVQKTINISPNETVVSNIQKPRIRKQPTVPAESSTPIKKIKHEVPIAPTPTPVPALCPISNTIGSTTIPPTSSPAPSASAYSGLDNFEELLPSTAIARQPEPPTIVQPEQPAPQPALSDSQLLAVPGEHFGGPPGSFYLCVEENGTFTPIDNRPLVLENNQLVPMPESAPALVQPERRDILEAALANSDVFHGETRDEAPDFRDLNANVSVHCRVSETSTTLNQPIMTPVEVPSKGDSEPAVPSNLEDGLAVIGVTPHTVPTSLELPITVTDPRIALKTTDPLSGNNYGTTLLPSPNTEMTFVSTEEVEVAVGGPISMPLLTEEESVGKSMPILTDDVAERTMSSVESTVGSPSSIDVRDSETDDGSQWSQRLLTPSSDASEMSAEITLRPQLKLSVSDIK